MGAIYSFEMSVDFHQARWYYIADDRTLHILKQLKCNFVSKFFCPAKNILAVLFLCC
jgi:hypothetical protein